MDNTFVRKDFYVDPPKAGASPEEWNTWLKKDKVAAAAAKRAFTKSQVHCDLPDSAQGTSIRKVGGVWKQSTAIGIVGGGEEGEGHLEPVVNANQEREYILARMGGTVRGVSHTRCGGDKRAARRARRKAKIAAKKAGGQ